jgi:hypothetical protein
MNQLFADETEDCFVCTWTTADKSSEFRTLVSLSNTSNTATCNIPPVGGDFFLAFQQNRCPLPLSEGQQAQEQQPQAISINIQAQSESEDLQGGSDLADESNASGDQTEAQKRLICTHLWHIFAFAVWLSNFLVYPLHSVRRRCSIVRTGPTSVRTCCRFGFVRTCCETRNFLSFLGIFRTTCCRVFAGPFGFSFGSRCNTLRIAGSPRIPLFSKITSLDTSSNTTVPSLIPVGNITITGANSTAPSTPARQERSP